MDNYRLVDCDFYDELEALATLRPQCQIIYYNQLFCRRLVLPLQKSLFYSAQEAFS